MRTEQFQVGDSVQKKDQKEPILGYPPGGAGYPSALFSEARTNPWASDIGDWKKETLVQRYKVNVNSHKHWLYGRGV